MWCIIFALLSRIHVFSQRCFFPQYGSVYMPQGTCVCVRPGRRQKMTPDLYLSAFKSRVLWLNTTTEQFVCCKALRLNCWFSSPCQVILPWQRWLQCYQPLIFFCIFCFFNLDSWMQVYSDISLMISACVVCFPMTNADTVECVFLNLSSINVVSTSYLVILLTCSNYLISSVPATPSDLIHICLQYTYSSCSCKQMCVCVIALICVHTCPEIVVIVSRATKQRAPFTARIYNLSNKWDAFMWPGPGSQAAQRSFPLE